MARRKAFNRLILGILVAGAVAFVLLLAGVGADLVSQ